MRVNHTDPWLRHDPFRTSRSVGFQTTRSSGNAIHGRAADDVAGREGAALLPLHPTPPALSLTSDFQAFTS